MDEEYENQQSWRTSHDKLTFILCRPVDEPASVDRVYAGEVDVPDRMVGDINLFLTPWEEDDEAEDASGDAQPKSDSDTIYYCNGEIDIMIAERDHRGKGLGISAVATLLQFIRRHTKSILSEYSAAQKSRPNSGVPGGSRFELKDLVAKINAGNASSIALFTKLGFRQRGEVNYFGELEMVLEGFSTTSLSAKGTLGPRGAENVNGYLELAYDRSRLEAQ